VDSLSATLAAFADPTRRLILHRLTEGPLTVNELAKPFRISQQAVSKHLAYLQRAKLIEKRKDGRRQICKLKGKPFKRVADWMEQYRRFWEESFDRLDNYLKELQEQEKKHGSKK
jgi:DNA-binding transcriptional ArsR family regulator